MHVSFQCLICEITCAACEYKKNERRAEETEISKTKDIFYTSFASGRAYLYLLGPLVQCVYYWILECSLK